MRIYDNCYELMSETGRNLWEMGLINKPKFYQNKHIENDENFITKELICEQYCLVSYKDSDHLFTYTNAKDWAEAEFQERVGNISLNPGHAWELRKDVWKEFLDCSGRFDYTYSERLSKRVRKPFSDSSTSSALNAVIECLNHDHDTRKAILPVFDASDLSFLDGNKRIPCSMYYDFLIREVNGVEQLNVTYHQRSSDFITHFGNDVWLALELMKYVSGMVGVKPGYLYHSIDSLHVYKKDWDTLKNGLTSNQLKLEL